MRTWREVRNFASQKLRLTPVRGLHDHLWLNAHLLQAIELFL